WEGCCCYGGDDGLAIGNGGGVEGSAVAGIASTSTPAASSSATSSTCCATIIPSNKGWEGCCCYGDDDGLAIGEKTAEIKENANVQERLEESQAQIYKIDLEHANKVLSMQDDELEPVELKEVVEVVTTAKLMTKVVTADSATITAATTLITAATITAAPSAAKRRKGVVIRDPEEIATQSIIIHSESKSKDKGKGILRKEKEDNAVMRLQGKYAKGLRLLVEDLLLPIQIDAADIKLRLLEQSAAVG
nr:hypothetical protein [Tanacetum cinerariifolium]